MTESDFALSRPGANALDPVSRPPRSRSTRDRRARLGTILFYGVIALAPLPFGSIDPLIISFWCVVLAAALILASDTGLNAFQRVALSSIGLAALAVAGTVYLQLAQPSLLAPHPIWQRAAEALGSPLTPVAAIAKNQPIFGLGNLIACGLALTVGLVLGGDRRRVRRGLDVFAGSCGLYAAYGIFAAVTEPTMLLGTRRGGYDGDVIGTFVYRNTAAVYFAAGAAMSILLLLRHSVRNVRSDRRTLKRVLAQVASTFDARWLAYLAAALTCTMAVLLSGSRAGFILFLAVMGLLFAGEAHRLRGLKPPVMWGLVVLALFLILRLSTLSIDARFAGSGFDDEGRFAVQAATLKLVFAHPLTGVGAGLFPLAFPAVRDIPPDIWGTYTKSFNVPLETAAEFGLPVALLLSLLFLAAGWTVWRARPEASKLVRRSGMILLLISGGHALMDYSLEVPGFAIVVSGLMGLILAELGGARPTR